MIFRNFDVAWESVCERVAKLMGKKKTYQIKRKLTQVASYPSFLLFLIRDVSLDPFELIEHTESVLWCLCSVPFCPFCSACCPLVVFVGLPFVLAPFTFTCTPMLCMCADVRPAWIDCFRSSSMVWRISVISDSCEGERKRIFMVRKRAEKHFVESTTRRKIKKIKFPSWCDAKKEKLETFESWFPKYLFLRRCC